MKLAPDIDATQRFRAAIGQQIGLKFDDTKLGFLGQVLQRRLETRGCGSEVYLCDLESGSTQSEISALARELTVGETYFFRNIEQFRALADIALSERMRVRRSFRLIRMLSAGCASGEEPYSMAIVAREVIADPSWKIEIRAVDLNPLVVEKSKRARYSAWSLRDTPDEVLAKWFRPIGREMAIDDRVKSIVTFEVANLASGEAAIWQPGSYDVVFCRNALMYFEPEQMRAVIERIAESLVPGGFLFLGHAETLRGVSDRFHLLHSHDTFYYQLKNESAGHRRPVMPYFPKTFAPPAMPRLAFDASWVDEIRMASERVAALLPDKTAEGTAEPRQTNFDPAPVFELIRQERFAEALDHVQSKPPRRDQDPDVLLLEVMLLAHSSELKRAEDAALRLLVVDEFNAGAHYVLALCREHAGDRERAAEHDRVAAYLDPVFAMPRLHLGLLARRAGDWDTARRELAQALLLLEREDASRLLLFGGGFNRGALIGLCKTVLGECGGNA